MFSIYPLLILQEQLRLPCYFSQSLPALPRFLYCVVLLHAYLFCYNYTKTFTNIRFKCTHSEHDGSFLCKQLDCTYAKWRASLSKRLWLLVVPCRLLISRIWTLHNHCAVVTPRNNRYSYVFIIYSAQLHIKKKHLVDPETTYFLQHISLHLIVFYWYKTISLCIRCIASNWSCMVATV